MRQRMRDEVGGLRLATALRTVARLTHPTRTAPTARPSRAEAPLAGFAVRDQRDCSKEPPYFCRNSFVQSKPCSDIWERPLRTAILLFLLALPLSVTAQTSQAEKPYISDFRACVRAHAADAQAAGVRTSGEAEDYFEKQCVPPLFSLFLGSHNTSPRSDSVPADEAAPPGLFRAIVRQEWRFLGTARQAIVP